MRDVAIVGFAQFPHTKCEPLLMEAEMMSEVITGALGQVDMERQDIGFWCSGSTDFCSGLPFIFVHVLDAIGPWPPAYESHVEMDGAWALYEAWLKLQHEEIDTALVYAHCKESTPVDVREVMTMQLDPYYPAPLWPDSVNMAALQAQALLDTGRYGMEDFAKVAVDNRAKGANNPNAQIKDPGSVEAIVGEQPISSPLSKSLCCPSSDGGAAIILAAGDKAKQLCERPAWIRGIDHRIESHSLGTRSLTESVSTKLAADGAGYDGKIDTAELYAPFAHQELILREALELGEDVEINPSGGALSAHSLMVAGLVRFGEVARRLHSGEADRALAHATSGPCLQQNMIGILEA